MKYASDFRESARNALKGRWGLAVITALVATLLGGIGANTVDVSIEIENRAYVAELEVLGRQVFRVSNLDVQTGFLAGSLVYLLLLGLVMAVIYFVLGSVVGVGYAKFNLSMLDGGEPSMGMLFSGFSHWGTLAAARFLQGLYTALWTLLLIVPGVVASYSYAMTEYILAEHPDLTAGEAIASSKKMMKGNRFRLFCLQFSFIGWAILTLLTFGIGDLWLTPYTHTAKAAFYRELTADPMYATL